MKEQLFDPSWIPLIKTEAQKPYYKSLQENVRQAYASKTIYPEKSKVLAALQLPADKVKVVLIGQDPYFNPGQAQGLSFSVPAGMRIPPSLLNIYKELEMEEGKPVRRSGDLSDWVKQGVLLLNQSLTVEAGKPNSHKDIGWKPFVEAIISYLNSLPQPMVFLLLGRNAQSLSPLLTNPNHLVLKAAHPSPMAANRGFFGSNVFKTCNEYLVAHHLSPIEWSRSNLS